MFERFGDEARQVVAHAQAEARALGHDSIGSAHLLLGILHLPGDGVAPGLLDSFGVTLADAREVLVRLEGRAETLGETGQMPFTADSRRALEESLREAHELRHRGIGAEHLLLALARPEGQSARVLADFDVDEDRVRDGLLRSLRHAPATEEPAAPVSHRLEPAAGRASVPVLPLLLGWFGFGAAVGIGILLGWLIWS